MVWCGNWSSSDKLGRIRRGELETYVNEEARRGAAFANASEAQNRALHYAALGVEAGGAGDEPNDADGGDAVCEAV